MQVRKVRKLPSKPQRNTLTKTLQRVFLIRGKTTLRRGKHSLVLTQVIFPNRDMGMTLAHNDTHSRALKKPPKFIQNPIKSIVSTWMNLFSSKEQQSIIFPPSLLTLFAISKPRFFQQNPLQWAGMRSQLYREWPDVLRAGTGIFLATVYKQSCSDGSLIDFESVNTSRFLWHHLATVAWQQPRFFQEWLTRTKKGNTFSEK